MNKNDQVIDVKKKSIFFSFLTNVPIQMLFIVISSYSLFMTFGLFFVLNKFAGVGIPAGNVIISMPFFKSILGFSDEMVSMIILIHLILDPFLVLVDVTINNLLVIFTQKIINIIKSQS